MKKVILLFALAIVATFSASAQMGMYEALEANGESAQYQEYWGVSKAETAGKYSIGGKRYIVTAKIERLPSGTATGFELIKVEDGKRWRSTSVMGDYERGIGYPHIATRHKHKKDGYVVIGDYIIELDGISEDGTSFSSISAIFIKLGGVAKSEEESDGKKKKMSFKEKMKAAKDKIKSATAASFGPEHKKASDTDLGKLVSDYLKEMKAKQSAGPTAKQKAEMKEIEFARKNKDADLKAYNDSIRATPEYKKLKEHQRRMAEMDKNSGGEKVTIVNASSQTIRVGESHITPGGRMTFNCSFDVWLMKLNKSRNVVERVRKLSSARSNCGSTITVN